MTIYNITLYKNRFTIKNRKRKYFYKYFCLRVKMLRQYGGLYRNIKNDDYLRLLLYGH